ncbi:MAG: DUF4190 domain-containing protein [Pseudonocardiaceae bacterium]
MSEQWGSGSTSDPKQPQGPAAPFNQPGNQPPTWGDPGAQQQPYQQQPYYQQPQFGSYQPGPDYTQPPRRPTNTLAIVSLVSSIVWLWGIGSVVALITGYLARQQIRQRGESGDGMAIAGLIIGGFGILLLFLVLVGFAAGGSSY